jgi:hypothetical protein
MNPPLLGKKHDYETPKNWSDWQFSFFLFVLDERSGHPPNHDNPSQVAESIILSCESSEDIDYVTLHGKTSPFKHDARRLNLKNHNHGMGFFARCSNISERLRGNEVWRSEMNKDKFNTIFNTTTEKSLQFDGDCSSIPSTVENIATCTLVWTSPLKNTKFVDNVTIVIAKKNFNKWVNSCIF